MQDLYFYDDINFIDKIKQASIKHQVLSLFTAFILVNENDKPNDDPQKPQKIDIPVIESLDYDSTVNLYQSAFITQQKESVKMAAPVYRQ